MFRKENLIHVPSLNTHTNDRSTQDHSLRGSLAYSEPDRLGLLAMGTICTHSRTQVLLGYDESDGSCSSSASLSTDKTGFVMA